MRGCLVSLGDSVKSKMSEKMIIIRMVSLFLLLIFLDSPSSVSASHFRGGIIMLRPQPGGTEFQMEIFYHISWRRSYPQQNSRPLIHYCDNDVIAAGRLQGGQNSNLNCQYGCPSTFVTQMNYVCTSFSDYTVEDWTFGERRLTYDFSFAAGNVVTIGFTGNAWIDPISSNWNLSTTFSLATRNDTGRINSTPRAVTVPVIRVQENCNYTIALAVSDPDNDIIRCRWAEGVECAGICHDEQFPGATLNSSTCTIEYLANMGARYWAAAVMIEDFTPDSLMPLSSVALQFLVLVISSDSDLCSRPRFVSPTIHHGSCVAIPPGTSLATQLIAESSSPDTSITEIQTAPPQGTRVGELTRLTDTNYYYVNVTWLPDAAQQNQTHLFCFSAVGSDRIASEQICFDLLSGYYPPSPIPATATPNRQLVHPSNTTWLIQFNTRIQRSAVLAYITFHEFNTDDHVYNIDTSQSDEVSVNDQNELLITPNFMFKEKKMFYITLDREVVRGFEQCGPGNEPVLDKNFWTFETMDVTPPLITFIENSTVNNANVTFVWESNENATYECMLMHHMVEYMINCSEGYWMGYSLNEGLYQLKILAVDQAGNAATTSYNFNVDVTPPLVVLLRKPNSVSNEDTSVLTFSCNESPCSYECSIRSDHLQNNNNNLFVPCDSGEFVTSILRTDSNYTFLVRATDQVGNRGESASYTWQTDFEAPRIFGIYNTSIICNVASPEYTGQGQVVDNRPERVLLNYSDVQSGCSIRRTWNAIDGAGNTAQLVQNINLEFSPTILRSPELALPCDSTSSSFEVSNNTVHVPNPCGLPIQIAYDDSEYMCPGNFQRNWTANVCGSSETASQTVLLYDLCPPHACGRNYSIPRGICSLGECQCNWPWYGVECNDLIYEPVAEAVSDTTIMEAQEYVLNIVVTQGTPPLVWSLLAGPTDLFVEQYSGRVIWNRAQAGNHSIIVRVENQVGRAEVEWMLIVIPGYYASLFPATPIIFPYAQPVLLMGHIEFIENSQIDREQHSTLPVQVDIISNRATRSIATNASINGNFSVIFHPLSIEYGMFMAGARHPSSMLQLPQVEFGILGMKSVPSTIALRGEAVHEFQKTFYNISAIYNDGPGPISGIVATPVLPNTRDIDVNVEIFLSGSTQNNSLQPGDHLLMDIRLETSALLTGFFLISIEAGEGTTLNLVASLQIDPALPHLSIDPPYLNTRIVSGRSRIFEFNVTNSGNAAAHNVRSILPQTSFISFISFGNAQSREGALQLQSRESALFSIIIQIPPSQQLGEIDATIIIAGSDVYTSLPIHVMVTSDTLMNLTVIVEDEYTYFASGQPLVTTAAVTLANYHKNIRITQYTEEGNGTVKFMNIQEDRYELFVEAPSHRSLRQIIVTSFESQVLTVFIERQTVIYTWSVTPITFEDIYFISIEADFETRVPIPVVTVNPNEINLDDLESGLISSIQLNITNHGLIRADNVVLQFPNHPFLQFSAANDIVGDLEPLSSVIVSINSSRRAVQKRNTFSALGNEFANAVNWAVYLIDVVYSYVCNEPQIRKTPVVLKQSTICNNDQLAQPIIRTPEAGETPINGRVYFTPGIAGPDTIATSPILFYPGRAGSRPRSSSSFSFNGYSTKSVFFCNPCFSAILECVPNPIDDALNLFPDGAYLPTTNARHVLTKLVNEVATKFIRSYRKGIKFLNVLKCAYDNGAFSKCLMLLSGNRNKRNIGRSLNELVEAMYPIHQSIALGIEILGDEVWIEEGDPEWLSDVLHPALDDESEAGVLISSTEFTTIEASPPPNGTTIEMVVRMVERINNTLFGWNSGQLEPNEGSNMASYSVVQQLTDNIATYNAIAVSKGFSSYLDAYNFASGQVNQIHNLEEEAGVCAVVRIRIQQELALTREAFLASLEIENLENMPLEEIIIEIIITDLLTREQATHLFSIGNGTLSGSLSNSVNDKWLLPSDSTGAVEWIIIPYSEAAPDSDNVYNVGGSFSYLLNNENITVPLFPTPIIVRPDPSLLVHYFWERHVVGDNPFTDDVELSIPFTLGVIVKNAGYGIAHSLQISTAQPEIIDNERGLLIDFMIISAIIGNASVTPSLTAMFGDLAPNATAVARWFMISSLQGEFMRYSATFENTNPLGDPKLSILDDLQIHELIRNVLIYTTDETDGILDFLVNDRNDYLAYPDTLYSSKTLTKYNVSIGTIISVQPSMDVTTSTHLVVQTLTSNTGWTYYRYEDTQAILSSTAFFVNGTKLERNQTVALPYYNIWITRDRNETSRIETFFLHILDYVETTDVVVYMLDPCSVNCPSLGLPFGRPAVKLPTPTVIISHPPAMLYAGTTTPLIITCSIEIDPSLLSYVNVSVTWLRGTSQLTNDTNRYSISPVLFNSQSIYISTVTIYPLSTTDRNTFSCRARIAPSNTSSLTIASDIGEDTVSVIIQEPTMPVVSIQSSGDSFIAGDSLNLTCSVVVVPNNLINDPLITWTGPGVNTNTVQVSREASELSLVFSTLLSSHGGVYTCAALISIPEAGVSVNATQFIVMNVQIPPPLLSVTGTPRDTDFFQGLDLMLSCNIELHSAVDSPIIVQSIWQKNKTQIGKGSNDRITVTNASISVPPYNYQTTLHFNPMDIEDADSYICTVTVTPQNETYITGTTVFVVRNITTIANFPSQNVTVTEDGNSISGHSDYSLLCTTTREPHLTSLSSILIQWLGPDGVVISVDNFITSGSEGSAKESLKAIGSGLPVNGYGSGSGLSRDTEDVFTITSVQESKNVVTSRLLFNSLMTSQAGEYTCRTLLSIPNIDVFHHAVDQILTVVIELPAPVAVMVNQSREGLLYEGTTFSLICSILLNMTGVDTDFDVYRRVSGPQTFNTVRINQQDSGIFANSSVQIVLMFFPLTMNDTGAYECSASINSTLPNLRSSDSVIYMTNISVFALPPPNVSIQSTVPLPVAGYNYTLICLALTENYLIMAPVLRWSSVEDIFNTSETDSIYGTSLPLTFSPLHTSHGGTYTCEISLDIPQAGIINLTNTVTKKISVQIPTPMVFIRDHPIPYNGTLFTLSGVVHFDTFVDTNITVVGVWSENDNKIIEQATTSPPYQTDLNFHPLSSDSSSQYILNITVTPTDSSPFIIGNSANIAYNLIVQPLPSQAPSVVVTSRDLSTEVGCGEARSLSCEPNAVENIFISPTIKWIGPGGNEVPIGGNDNPMVSFQTGQLIFTDINTANSGAYLCRAVVNISEAQIFDHYDDFIVIINTQSPEPITKLMCNQSLSSLEIFFSWEHPTMHEGVTGYQVEVEELQQKDDTKEVVTFEIASFNTKYEEAYLDQGLRGMVPYKISVKALNSAGCGQNKNVYCFTEEGVPPPPKNVFFSNVNSTAINVTWDKQTLVELKGLADYIVEYNQYIPNRKRQSGNTVIVPWTENHVIISNLKQGAQYSVSVSVSTSVGVSDVVPGTRKISSSPTMNSDTRIIIIATVLSTLLIIAIGAIIVITAVVIYKKNKKNKFKLKPKRSKSSKMPVTSTNLSDISPDNYYAYDNPCYEDVKLSMSQAPETKLQRSYL